jgi:hypothetical protein
MQSWKEKWQQLPLIGKIGIVIAVLVPMGLMIAGLITVIIKLAQRK